MISRTEVFEAINGEREYQLKRWGKERNPGVLEQIPKSVGEYLVYMQDYLSEAIHNATRSNGDESTLQALRKVVTLGVACFEEHGVPKREAGPVQNGRNGKTY